MLFRSLIEPPLVPERPSKPNRLAIGMLGSLMSFAVAAGVGVVVESLDDRIYGRRGVSRLLGVPPLAVIPRIENAEIRRKRLKNRITAVVGVLVAIVAIALLLHFFYRPLDVLFYQAMRKVGI